MMRRVYGHWTRASRFQFSNIWMAMHGIREAICKLVLRSISCIIYRRVVNARYLLLFAVVWFCMIEWGSVWVRHLYRIILVELSPLWCLDHRKMLPSVCSYSGVVRALLLFILNKKAHHLMAASEIRKVGGEVTWSLYQHLICYSFRWFQILVYAMYNICMYIHPIDALNAIHME
jgi:hypothetical protein